MSAVSCIDISCTVLVLEWLSRTPTRLGFAAISTKASTSSTTSRSGQSGEWTSTSHFLKSCHLSMPEFRIESFKEPPPNLIQNIENHREKLHLADTHVFKSLWTISWNFAAWRGSNDKNFKNHPSWERLNKSIYLFSLLLACTYHCERIYQTTNLGHKRNPWSYTVLVKDQPGLWLEDAT